MNKETKPKWYNLYFDKWFPMKIGEMIIVILVSTVVGILCKVV